MRWMTTILLLLQHGATCSTSLSNIFGNSPGRSEEKQNESLKYTPPKVQSIVLKNEEESKVTECVFACALLVYEWTQNTYLNKGKSGFAILKGTKNNIYNMVLYSENKTTLSSTTITTKLEITVQGNHYISFYDNLSKYWSIYATAEEIKKIVELLSKLSVVIKNSMHNEKEPPKPFDSEDTQVNINIEDQLDKGDKASDTDSSVNKSKVSILSRMANMGHSVFPAHTTPLERTSDSSDTNEIQNRPKNVRHKPVKSIVKRINTDHNSQDSFNRVHKIIGSGTEQFVNTMPLYTFVNGQIVPVSNTNTNQNIEVNSGSDINLFITEQRVCNSELRINMNRVTDKVEQVLDIIKDLKCSNENRNDSNYPIDVLHKLLAEYENKIRTQEQIIFSSNVNNSIPEGSLATILNYTENSKVEMELYKNKIIELETKIKEKNCAIATLNDKVKVLTEKLVVTQKNEGNMKLEISNMKSDLDSKNDELVNVTRKLEESVASGNNDDGNAIETQLKTIMNDTFQAILVNFENSENYSGEIVKNVMAKLIKKVTFEALRNK